MDNNMSLIAIDAGNTSVKIGIFISGELTEVFRMKINELHEWKQDHRPSDDLPVVASSVLNESEQEILRSLFNSIQFVNQYEKLPFTNGYATPKTVGMDRLCNIAAVSSHSPGLSKLVIDLGTCVKFDFIDDQNTYKGGSIAPGIRLRYQAMHEFTGRLPLLSAVTENIPLIGNSTQLAIQSGVQNGMCLEIQGMIEAYRTKYPDLTIFMTGGDLSFFDFEGKNDIFVDENLTLKGIYAIYSLHAH